MSSETSLMVIAISVALLTVFAIVASIFLIQLLITLKKTTQTVELKVNPLLEQARNIANITSDTTELIRNNIGLTTPLFHSIGKISNLMEGFPNRFKNDMHDNHMTVNFEAEKRKNSVSDWAEWLALGIILIQRLRHKK